MNRARDFQRSKLYRWEDWVATRSEEADQEACMTLQEISLYAQQVLKHYKITKKIEIKDGRGTRRAYAYEYEAMGFPKVMRKNWIVLHECAHIITSYLFRHVNGSQKALSDHGPVFLGIYTELLVKFLRLDKDWLVSTAKDQGLKIWSDVTPKQIRYYQQRFKKSA